MKGDVEMAQIGEDSGFATHCFASTKIFIPIPPTFSSFFRRPLF